MICGENASKTNAESSKLIENYLEGFVHVSQIGDGRFNDIELPPLCTLHVALHPGQVYITCHTALRTSVHSRLKMQSDEDVKRNS